MIERQENGVVCAVTGGGYQRLWPCHSKSEDLSPNPPLCWKALNEIIHPPDCRPSSETPLQTPTSEMVSCELVQWKRLLTVKKRKEKVFCFLCDEEEKEEENQPHRSHVSVHCDEQLELEHKTLSLHLVFTLHSEQRERERQLKECQWHLLPWAPQWRSIEIILTQPSLTKTPLYVCVCVCSQSMWSGTSQHLYKAMPIVPSKDETLKLLFCILI